ncbi:MAG TPA: type I 3-dehydroquinate dehydratase [Planctomycetota bacterium]|nr:type I 3-dehydroquinate dehydratase [Planctomycetota bacterium]
MRRFVVETLLDPLQQTDPRVDAVELRLDLHPDADVREVRRRHGKPVIATVRRVADGGRFAGSEEERRRLFARAGAADWVDVEVDALPSVAPPGPHRITSFHDVRGMPEDLDAVFERCLLRGGDLVKIAVTPGSAVEAFRLLDLPAGAIGMGPFGTFTRVLAPLTYCAREPLAPGMPTPEDLFDVFRIRRHGPAPALYGVVGDPIEHSRSPHLFNAAFERDGVDALYLRFRVADLAAFWPVFLAHGGRGLSVTAPLKVQAARLATAPSEEVRACGSANTLLADGRAYSTDYRALLALIPGGLGGAVVMGAGGAARAALLALRRRGYDPAVWCRRPEEAKALGAAHAPSPDPFPLVINTTPVDPPDAEHVIDLRYGQGIRPPKRGVGGLAFLEAQAAHQRRIFLGHEG